MESDLGAKVLQITGIFGGGGPGPLSGSIGNLNADGPYIAGLEEVELLNWVTVELVRGVPQVRGGRSISWILDQYAFGWWTRRVVLQQFGTLLIPGNRTNF
jgi:hypothetical protein